jgi:hypothetical protein
MENTEPCPVAPPRPSSRPWNRVVRLRRGGPGTRTTVSGIATATSTSVRDVLVNALFDIIDDRQSGRSDRWANDEIWRARALLRKVRDATTDAEVAALLTGCVRRYNKTGSGQS